MTAKTSFTAEQAESVGKIALVHLNEFPDHHTQLQKMEQEAERGE